MMIITLNLQCITIIESHYKMINILLLINLNITPDNPLLILPDGILYYGLIFNFIEFHSKYQYLVGQEYMDDKLNLFNR